MNTSVNRNETFRNFVAWAEPVSKTAFLRVFSVLFDYPAHSLQETVLSLKQMLPMESKSGMNQ